MGFFQLCTSVRNAYKNSCENVAPWLWRDIGESELLVSPVDWVINWQRFLRVLIDILESVKVARLNGGPV